MRRFFSGPGIYNFDMALLKDTQVTESFRVQFRAEAFNVFNHASSITHQEISTTQAREASGLSLLPEIHVSCNSR